MPRAFNPTSKLVRSASAVAAVLATLLVVGLVDGLFTHHNGQAHFANARPAVIAHR
jgi:hypothetical protein